MLEEFMIFQFLLLPEQYYDTEVDKDERIQEQDIPIALRGCLLHIG